MSLLVIAVAAAVGVPAGEVAGVVIAAGVVSLGTLALVRWRCGVDWDDLYRKLQARDFGDPLT